MSLVEALLLENSLVLEPIWTRHLGRSREDKIYSTLLPDLSFDRWGEEAWLVVMMGLRSERLVEKACSCSCSSKSWNACDL
jgi:hypothetical protein